MNEQSEVFFGVRVLNEDSRINSRYTYSRNIFDTKWEAEQEALKYTAGRVVMLVIQEEYNE